jgi:uncharacterized membrane protein YoaK (UPF0700 family)
VLTLETLLLVGFAVTFAAVPLFGAPATPAVAAVLFGLAAMGVQSAAVRLLMRGVGSTNVMTTTTSQIAVDATQLTWGWLHRNDASAETRRQLGACRQRLWSGLPLPLGFFLGTLLGAVGFAQIGDPVLAAPVAVVAALALWSGRWEVGGP